MISQDIQELNESLKQADIFLSNRLNTQDKAEEVLHAIVIKALELVENEVEFKNIVFDYRDIYSAVWGEGDSEKAARTVRPYLNSIIEQKLSSSSALNSSLKSQGVSTLSLKIETSTGGKRTTFNLVTQTEETESEAGQDSSHIRYIATQFKKPYWWVKPFTDVTLSTKRAFFLVMLGVLLACTGLIIALKAGSGDIGAAVTTLILIAVGVGLYILFRFHELTNKGVTEIPFFMVPLKQANSLFTLSRDNTDGAQNLKVLAIVYQAKCPICGDKIIIEKSKEFYGRYIGKCSVAPNEHIYSFDHVLKTGKLLR